jgi:predicted PurR-regulated permease PerM
VTLPPPTETQARLIWTALTGLAFATLVGLVVALIWGLGQVLGLLAPVLWPLAVAGVIAYLLDPVVDYLEHRRVPRPRGILCVFALALMTVAAVIGSVVPRIVVETRELVGRVPVYATNLHNRVEAYINDPPQVIRSLLRLPASWLGTNRPTTNLTDLPPGQGGATSPATTSGPVVLRTTNVGPSNATSTLPAPSAAAESTGSAQREPSGETVEGGPSAPGVKDLIGSAQSWGIELDPKLFTSATSWLTGLVQKLGSWAFGQVGRVAAGFGALVGVFLIPVYAFYFLLEKRGIESKWTEYLPLTKSHLKDEVAFVLGSINNYLIAFFRGQVLVAICDGILYAIGFSLIGLPYAVLLGAVATVLTLIPYIGAAITFAAAVAIAFVQYTDWLHPLMALGVYVVVQLLEGFVIQPKILGDRVGLHPLTIIIAVITGTTLLGGVLGGILAIPLTAALRVLMFRYVWRRGPPTPRKPA